MPAGRPLIDHCFGELKRWLSFGPKAAQTDMAPKAPVTPLSIQVADTKVVPSTMEVKSKHQVCDSGKCDGTLHILSPEENPPAFSS